MFSLIAPFKREHLRSPHIIRLADYWDAKRGTRRIPDRGDFDLDDLRSVLPYMIVVDIEPQPFRVFYRLAGTKVVEMNGLELKGLYLDELTGDQADFIESGLAAYREAWENQIAVFGAYRWHTPRGAECDVEFGIFPVTHDGQPTQCLAAEDWDVGDVHVVRQEQPPPMVKKTPPQS
jgi:hypothetical protein